MSGAVDTTSRTSECCRNFAASGVSWLLRLVGSFAAFATWAVVSVAILALFFAAPDETGLDSLLPLSNLLLILTIGYYAASLPFVLLPLNSDQLYRWFLYLEVGWVVSLLAAVAGLFAVGDVAAPDFAVPLTLRTSVIVAAALFLIPMLIVLSTRAKGPRRIAVVLQLFGAWLAIQSAGFVVIRTDLLSEEVVKAAVPVFALLLSALIVCSSLPQKPETRHDLVLFTLFGWSFLLLGAFAWMIRAGQISEAKLTGFSTFVCITFIVLAAPAFNWLGMPWTNDRRWGWSLCIAASLGVLAYVALQVPVAGDRPALLQVWETYRGPNL